MVALFCKLQINYNIKKGWHYVRSDTQIAIRIKELREIHGITLESLAKEFEITKEQYEEYESGEIDIPVSLYKIASKFNVELTQF